MTDQIVARGMPWLGDSIYQRCVVRELARNFDVWLETPWPELVRDLPIRCVRPDTTLRWQARNIARSKDWHVAQPLVPQRTVRYRSNHGKTMLQAMCESVGVRARSLTFDLPSFAAEQRDPYIVVRPATIRAGWKHDSRNPLPEYLAMAVDRMRSHLRIVSVADIGPGADRPESSVWYADETFHAGELNVEQLLALVENAAGVIGGVGWMLPAAIAYQVPMLLIFGGRGLHNAPSRIFDERMNIGGIAQTLPGRFCMCGDHDHECDRRIGNIEAKIEQWAIRLPARREGAVAAGDGHRILPGSGAAVR